MILIKKGSARVFPMDLVLNAEFVCQCDDFMIVPAKKMIIMFNMLLLDLDGASQASQLIRFLQQGHVNILFRQMITGGQSGQASPNDDHFFGLLRVGKHCVVQVLFPFFHPATKLTMNGQYNQANTLKGNNATAFQARVEPMKLGKYELNAKT